MRRILGPVVALALLPTLGLPACESSSSPAATTLAFEAGTFEAGPSTTPEGETEPSDAQPPEGGAPQDASDGSAPTFTTFHVAMGSTGACAVFPDGRMKCWGRPLVGAAEPIGDSPGQMGAALAKVSLPKRVRTIRAATSGLMCIIFEDGGLRCWGGSALGQAAPGGPTLAAITTNIDLGAGRTAIDVAPGANHACAVLDDGTVKCWGSNPQGQLGLGDATDRATPPAAPIDLGAGRTAKAITAGRAFTCALLDNDRIKCWGANNNTISDSGIGGELCIGGTAHIGDGPNEMGDNLPFAKLGTNPATSLPWKVKRVIAREVRACAVLENDRIKCWGRNDGGGALGSGDSLPYGDSLLDDAIPFVDVGTDPATSKPWAVSDLALGDVATCALLPNGVVHCWGQDSSFGTLGQGGNFTLGDGPGEMGAALVDVALKPARVPTRLFGAAYSMCARVDTSTLDCWGSNNQGVLGQGVAFVNATTTSVGDAPGEMGASLAETFLE
jgi:hypothetical protein